MVYEQPSVEVFGILIQEPVTTFTDLLISAVCFYAFIKLSRIDVQNKVHFFLRYYFLSMGLATATGGLIGHGFLYLFSFEWKLVGWITSMLSIALVERAAIEYARPLIKPKVGVFFAWWNLTELIIFIVITLLTLNFFFVEVHSAYGLLVVVTGFNFFVYSRRKNRGSKLFLFAVGFSAISALIYMNKWGVSPWFNHYDISHVFMTISAWVFYLASKEILNDPVLDDEKEIK